KRDTRHCRRGSAARHVVRLSLRKCVCVYRGDSPALFLERIAHRPGSRLAQQLQHLGAGYMEGDAAPDGGLRTAMGALHANHGASAPHGRLSHRKRHSGVCGESATGVSDELERFWAARGNVMASHEQLIVQRRRRDHRDSAEHLARQLSHGFDAVRYLSAAGCGFRCANQLWFPNHSIATAQGVHAARSGHFRLGQPERCSSEYGDGCEPLREDIAALTPSHVVSALNLSGIDRSFGNGTLFTWTTGVERKIGNLTADASYVGTAAEKLPRF